MILYFLAISFSCRTKVKVDWYVNFIMPIFITVLKQSAGNKEKCNKVVHVSFLKLDKNVSSIKMFKMSPTNFVIA